MIVCQGLGAHCREEGAGDSCQGVYVSGSELVTGSPLHFSPIIRFVIDF